MEDTPEHIKELQLKIWLQKTPGERLYQTIKSNEELFLFWKEANKNLMEKKTQEETDRNNAVK